MPGFNLDGAKRAEQRGEVYAMSPAAVRQFSNKPSPTPQMAMNNRTPRPGGLY
jgi:hypothetical protein